MNRYHWNFVWGCQIDGEYGTVGFAPISALAFKLLRKFAGGVIPPPQPLVGKYTLSLCCPSNRRQFMLNLSAVDAKILHSSWCILRSTFGKEMTGSDQVMKLLSYWVEQPLNDSSPKSFLQQLNVLHWLEWRRYLWLRSEECHIWT